MRALLVSLAHLRLPPDGDPRGLPGDLRDPGPSWARGRPGRSPGSAGCTHESIGFSSVPLRARRSPLLRGGLPTARVESRRRLLLFPPRRRGPCCPARRPESRDFPCSPGKTRLGCQEWASQRMTSPLLLPSATNMPPVASSLPSGEKATLQTWPLFPSQRPDLFSGLRVPDPHRPVKPGGRERLAIRRKASPRTTSVWPSSVCCTPPVWTSINRTLKSTSAAARSLPSGENRRSRRPSSWPDFSDVVDPELLPEFSDRLLFLDVPELHRADKRASERLREILSADRQQLAVGRKDHASHGPLERDRLPGRARFRVDQLHRHRRTGLICRVATASIFPSGEKAIDST